MRLGDISAEDVLAGKNWLLQPAGEEDANPVVKETPGFTVQDAGLFSALVKIADGSVHPALVVKSFPQGGDDIDVYIRTSHGWLNIHAPGFMRALGKYSHELFPFDYFLATPWKGGQNPRPDPGSPHVKAFREAAGQLKSASSP